MGDNLHFFTSSESLVDGLKGPFFETFVWQVVVYLRVLKCASFINLWFETNEQQRSKKSCFAYQGLKIWNSVGSMLFFFRVVCCGNFLNFGLQNGKTLKRHDWQIKWVWGTMTGFVSIRFFRKTWIERRCSFSRGSNQISDHVFKHLRTFEA